MQKENENKHLFLREYFKTHDHQKNHFYWHMNTNKQSVPFKYIEKSAILHKKD